MIQQSESKSATKVARKGAMANPFLKAVSVFVLVVVSVGFVLLINAINKNGPQDTGLFLYGSYDGVGISSEYDSYFLRKARSYNRDNSSNTPYLHFQYYNQAFKDTLLHLALLSKAKDLGIAVSDVAVYKELATYEELQDAKGNLDLEVLKNHPKLKQLISDTRSEKLHMYMMKDLSVLTTLSEKEEKFFTSTYAPRRSVELLVFNYLDLTKEEIVTYAKEHPELFKQLSYAIITLDNAELATSLQKELEANPNSFAEIAKANSIESTRDAGGVQAPMFLVDIPQVFPDEAIAKQVGALKVGQVIGPYTEASRQGTQYKFVKILAEPALANFEDGQTIEAIRRYLSQSERGLLETILSKKAEAFLLEAKTTGFSEQAKKLGKTLSLTNPFPINLMEDTFTNPFIAYGYAIVSPEITLENNQPLQGASSQEKFFTTAFMLKPKEISDPIAFNGQVVLMSLKAETSDENFMNSYFGNLTTMIIRQLNSEDIERLMVDPAKVQNNFDAAYNKKYGGNVN